MAGSPRHVTPETVLAWHVAASDFSECLDHVIVVNEIGLSRILKRYLAYDHRSRTHLPLDKDSPVISHRTAADQAARS
jgi:hypothetical protein